MRWPLPWPKSWRKEAPPEAEAPGEERPKTLREQVLLFARDLAVAFLIVAIVMGLLTAYTRVWPPMVVVESDSMQHANAESMIGAIDTGDLVLVQTVSVASDVTTYVQGRVSGYSTYSNYGDVIVFYKSADRADTPVIHRAIIYLVPNATGGFDAPSLQPPFPRAEWRGENFSGGGPAETPFGLQSVTLVGVGAWPKQQGGSFHRQDLTFASTGFSVSGFLTKGDHNQASFDSGSVPVGRILGKARGELPWFGLLKLTLFPGRSGCCPGGWGTTGDNGAPKNSWDALLVSLVLIVLGPFLAEFGWSYVREWREKRREAKAPASPTPEEVPPAVGGTPEAPPEAAPEPAITDEDRTESAGPEGGVPGPP